MKKSSAIVTRLDKARLEPHLASGVTIGPTYALRALLERAKVVAPEDVPANVVTMNSRVKVRDPRDQALETYVLAYPDCNGAGTLSVLSPLGSALLAAREGDIVPVMGARTARLVTVEELDYQPERAGEFDL